MKKNDEELEENTDLLDDDEMCDQLDDCLQDEEVMEEQSDYLDEDPWQNPHQVERKTSARKYSLWA